MCNSLQHKRKSNIHPAETEGSQPIWNTETENMVNKHNNLKIPTNQSQKANMFEQLPTADTRTKHV